MEAGDAGNKAAPPPDPSQMRAARTFESSGDANQTPTPGGGHPHHGEPAAQGDPGEGDVQEEAL